MHLTVWEYRIRTAGSGRVFESRRCLTPDEYAIPGIRAEAERIAERELFRFVESVVPEERLERSGWRHVTLSDDA